MRNILNEIRKYDVIWNSPSKTDRGAMPLGNGETVLNLWAQENGDLQFYFARSDTLTELDRNVKLGKIHLGISSNPFAKGNYFKQKLSLTEGCIDIKAGKNADDVKLKVVIDSEKDCILITGEFRKPAVVTAKYTNWRKTPIPEYIESTPLEERAFESADIIESTDTDIVFYHQNGVNNIKWMARVEGLYENVDKVNDLLTNRIFGGVMTLTDSKVKDGSKLESDMPVTCFCLKISTQSKQVESLEHWKDAIYKLHNNSYTPKDVFTRTAKWWENYWKKSWVFIDGDKPISPSITDEIKSLKIEQFSDEYEVPSTATAAYILTKFMFECNARGNQPIRFNGLNYVTMPSNGEGFDFTRFAASLTGLPEKEPSIKSNPDDRPWGNLTLWQNIRLPYMSMLARNEFEEIKALFRYYLSFRDINREIAKVYYNAEGQFNTEITMTCGLLNAFIYGTDRTNKALGYSENRAGGAVDISPGLELISLMLDYYEYTKDDEFLHDEILVYAKDLMLYIETRFKEREDGKVVLYPIHSVETYYDTLNATPTIAGMHTVLNRIITLPLDKKIDRSFFERIQTITPEIPIENYNGKRVIAPAVKYDMDRFNVEVPELYTIFPFKMYGLNKPNYELINDTYETSKRHGNFRPFIIGEPPGVPSFSGWQYMGSIAAMLGKANDVKYILENNCSLKNPGHRFPASWGPCYDSVPDVDHGANVLNTIQLMLMQYDGEKIYLLPALPDGWNVKFKLYAPLDTSIEFEYKNGEIIYLNVTPKSRRKDVYFQTYIES